MLHRIMILLLLASVPVGAQDLSATLGMQRAAAPSLEWASRDASHPALGPLRTAFLRKPVETTVGNARVYSRASLSCQQASHRFAIELASGTSERDPSGLKQSGEPRLFCSRPLTPFDERLVQEEMLTSWEIGANGIALMKNYRPFPLRECVSILVQQEIVLPAGWSQKTARVEFTLLPYNREIDSVFANCGEVSAYGTPASALDVTAAMPPQDPPPPPAPAAQVLKIPTSDWQNARVTNSGRTHVRAAPNVSSAIVDTLDPGAVVLVQKSSGDWYQVRSASDPPFEGYIRRDRLVFR